MNHQSLVNKSLIFILLFLLHSLSYNALAEGVVEIHVVKNLENDLLIYDEDEKNFFPYIPNTSIEFPTLSYYINLKLYSGYKLRHCLPKESSLFVDQKIVDFSKDNSCKLYSIDSLRNVFQKDSLFITIYNSSLTNRGFSISVISEQVQNLENQENASGIFSIIARDLPGYKDFFIIGIIIIMILIAILYNGNTKYFHEFFNLPKALSLKIREESYLPVKNFSGAYLLFLIVHSFLLGFIVLAILHYQEEGFREIFSFINTTSFLTSFVSWLKISFLILALLIVKYILVKAISQLFNISGFSTVHFFDYIRMSISFFLLLLIAFFIFYFSFNFEEQIWLKYLVNSTIVFFIIRVIILFFKLYKYAPFRNLHLFLYICSTEILPLMIGFKIFIK